MSEIIDDEVPVYVKGKPVAPVMLRIAQDPKLAIKEPSEFARYLRAWEKEIADVPKDASVAKNRETMRSVAANLGKAAVALDKARKETTAELRAKVTQINNEAGPMEAAIRALQTRVRAPLTAWETAEQTRENNCKATIARLNASINVLVTDTAADVRERLDWARGINDIDRENYRDMLEDAEAARTRCIDILTRALADITQREKDAADLAELRQQREEQEARARRDRELASQQMADAQRISLAIDGMRGAADAKDSLGWSADRLIHYYDTVLEHLASFEEREWGDRKEEAKAIRDVTQVNVTAKRAEALKIKEQQDAATAEAQRQAGIEAERKRAEALRQAEEAEAGQRGRRRAHRQRMNRAAAEALVTHAKLKKEDAVAVVEAIVRGEIPAVTLAY